MDSFLENTVYQNQQKYICSNRYTSVKVAESIRNNLPKQNATGPDWLTGEI